MTDTDAGDTVLATLGGTCFGIYWHLTRRANAERQCWPSLDTIAEANKLSRKHVTRCLDLLEEAGWIIRSKRTNGYGLATSTLYTVNDKPRTFACDQRGTSPRQALDTGASQMSHELDTNQTQTKETNVSVAPPKSKRRQQVPEDFYPDDAGVNYAMGKGMPFAEVPRQVEKFVTHHGAKGTTFLDVGKAWQTWAGNYQEFGRARSPNGASPNGRPDFAARAAALRAAEGDQP